MSTGRAQQDGLSVCKFISGSRTHPERAEIHTPHVGCRAPSALGVTAERSTSLLIIIAQLRAVQEDSEKTGTSRRQGLGSDIRNVSECGALLWCFCALKSWGVPPLWGPLWKVCKKWAFQLVVCSPASNTVPPTGRRAAGLRAPLLHAPLCPWLRSHHTWPQRAHSQQCLRTPESTPEHVSLGLSGLHCSELPRQPQRAQESSNDFYLFSLKTQIGRSVSHPHSDVTSTTLVHQEAEARKAPK